MMSQWIAVSRMRCEDIFTCMSTDDIYVTMLLEVKSSMCMRKKKNICYVIELVSNGNSVSGYKRTVMATVGETVVQMLAPIYICTALLLLCACMFDLRDMLI